MLHSIGHCLAVLGVFLILLFVLGGSTSLWFVLLNVNAPIERGIGDGDSGPSLFFTLFHRVWIKFTTSHELVDSLDRDAGLHCRGDHHGQHGEGEPEDIEQGQRGEGFFGIEHVVLIREDIDGKSDEGNHKGGTSPKERDEGGEVADVEQDAKLSVPDVHHLLHEARLPRVQLEYFHPTEKLVHFLHPDILLLHHLNLRKVVKVGTLLFQNLKLPRHSSRHTIDRNENDHHNQTSYHTGTQDLQIKMLVKQPRLVLVNYHLVQHVYCHGDLQGRGPEHVEVGKHVGDLLSVHRHKVDNLARSRTFLGLGCDREGLAIDGRYKGRLDPKANQVHPVEVGGEEEGLHEGHEEKADRVEHTAPHWGVGRARKVDDCFQEDGGDEDGDVVDELQTAARKKAEAKADDKWTEDRKVFFGEVAFTWLDLHLSTIARREAGLWNLPG